MSTPQAAVPGTAEVVHRLRQVVDCLGDGTDFRQAVAALQRGEMATFSGVWGSSCALLAAALCQHAPQLVVLTSSEAEAESLLDELPLFTSRRVAAFPAWETFSTERVIQDEIFGDRIRLLKQLLAGALASPQGGDPVAPAVAGSRPVIVTSIPSLLQPVPHRETLLAQSRKLTVGQELDLDELCAWLARQGFEPTTAVALPGEFSRRGGILDLYAPDWLAPARVEFFGDMVESIRTFDVATQRSLETLTELEITLVEPSSADRGMLTDYLPPDSWFLLIEPAEIEAAARRYLQRVDTPQDFHTPRDVLQAVYRHPTATAERLAGGALGTLCHLPLESVERFSGDVHKVRSELESAAAGQQVFLVCATEAESQRLREIFAPSPLIAQQRLHFVVGRLHSGFRLVPQQIALLSSDELFQRTELVRRSSRRLGKVIDSFLELRPGELVVHVAHGIARYHGLTLLEKEGHTEEHLELEFHGGTRVYVPASKIHLVQKYVGSAKARPALARLHSKTWQRQKQQAQRAVFDLAADMLQLQAARAAQSGIPFAEDSTWQREFEAAFPYVETPDQRSAMESIRRDMQQPRPMDRLVCGDVGFGKTELAMRAAFKAVDNGYQVAVLVPTTVLADQHYRTFTARMSEFPFQIAMLSRFCSRAEQRDIVERTATGAIDILIGTHRLVQKDVQFHNLGLVIIDEEQRFGVEVKERLKQLRQIVDVLTLTATPIPRTLHMALLGLRDICNLETPPADRQAIETTVTRFDPELIRHAVLRELNRGGQIYFVHNRVQDIDVVAQQLQKIVPEASLRIGHGQMPEEELEQVMLDFARHCFDLLLCTTIIESGLDIPNANTIFINQADRFGLADLHQLRGRVGRSWHRAYCYLLLDPHKHIPSNAARRLRAVEEFHELGAGFALAMRDLEIRGAGNLLGTEQSGHINAVGYELYCELLENAVRTLRRLPPRLVIDTHVQLPGEAFLPREYVPDLRLKIDIYRRLARVTNESELEDLRTELTDRFGPPPPPVERMLRIMRLRLLAHCCGIRQIHREDRYLVLDYRSGDAMQRLQQAAGRRLRMVDASTAYYELPLGCESPDALLAEAEQLLEAKSPPAVRSQVAADAVDGRPGSPAARSRPRGGRAPLASRIRKPRSE
jgi:transcription-repair coupling factor (superfamily II helicase)